MFIVETLRFLAARLSTEERGATAVEYGLLVALIAAVIVGIVGLLGGQVAAGFQTICTALNNNVAC